MPVMLHNVMKEKDTESELNLWITGQSSMMEETTK